MRDLARGRLSSRIFCALALLFGGLYLLVNPPFAVNDEDVHLARLYELAGGQLFTRSDEHGDYHYVPRDFQELGDRYQRIPQWAGGRVSVKALVEQLQRVHAEPERVRVRARAGGYIPVAYHLQLPAVWLARQLELGAFWHIYMARSASLAVYLALSMRALHVAGALAWPFAAVALMPMALTQAAGVSADGFIIGLSLLFFAYIAKAGVLAGPPLRPRQLAEVAAALVLMTLAKPVYVGAGLALFLLRWEEGPRARIFRWLFPAVVVGTAVGLFVYWSQLKGRYEEAGSSAYSSGAQLRLLLAQPQRIPALAFDGVLRYGEELLLQSIFVRYRISPGMRFAGGVGSVVYAQLLLALAWGAARTRAGATFQRRALSLAILLGTWLALLSAVPLSLYLCCTELGAGFVRSVHGRYLIPAFPALLLALAMVGRPVLGRWLTGARGRLALLLIVSVNLLCLFSLIGWHYYSPDLEWPL